MLRLAQSSGGLKAAYPELELSKNEMKREDPVKALLQERNNKSDLSIYQLKLHLAI